MIDFIKNVIKKEKNTQNHKNLNFKKQTINIKNINRPYKLRTYKSIHITSIYTSAITIFMLFDFIIQISF